VLAARAYIVLFGSLAVCSPQAVRTQQQHDVADVLRKAGAYVEEFQRQLSGIVAEESYRQEVVPFLGTNARGGVPFQRRRLRSDLLLVRPEEAVTWVQFRDVFEVDGRPVRDRAERLTTLFLAPGLSSTERVQQIRAESARYNIGGIQRTMNVPVLPLAVLALPSQPRFRFTVDQAGDNDRPRNPNSGLPSTTNFRVTAAVLIVKFEERQGPTLVHTQDGNDILSRGRFWIEPDTGRVLMSEMITEDGRVRGELLVSYQSEPLLGFLVPIELRERYAGSEYKATIIGEATYSNFRRFEVNVDEAIGPFQ
jgi:hypothetical protein